MQNVKENLLDLTPNGLKKAFELVGIKAFRADQVLNWLYKNFVFNLDHMVNLSQELRTEINNNFALYIPQISHISESKSDNSYKFLLKTCDDGLIESILMLDGDRSTVCVSCMIGCPMGCKFCATGSQIGFVRKLSAAEIVGQVLMALRYGRENGLIERVNNIVFMGMGEPFANLKAVEDAICILIDPKGLAMSPAKISVSTAFPNANVADFVNRTGVRLAVSLHFPTNDLRSKYMPVNKFFPIEEIIKELRRIELKKRDCILIEYILLSGINDSILHAKQLLSIIGNLKVKVNLIPYNPTELFPEKASSKEKIDAFTSYLNNRGVFTSVRKSRGLDVEGGCGQFALKKS